MDREDKTDGRSFGADDIFAEEADNRDETAIRDSLLKLSGDIQRIPGSREVVDFRAHDNPIPQIIPLPRIRRLVQGLLAPDHYTIH